MAILISIADNKETIYELEQDSLVIGRKEYCDICLKDYQVSKRHARIIKDTTHFVIEDLESRNGTYINGKRVERAVLRDGDRIKLAETILVYHSNKMQQTARRIRRDNIT